MISCRRCFVVVDLTIQCDSENQSGGRCPVIYSWSGHRVGLSDLSFRSITHTIIRADYQRTGKTFLSRPHCLIAIMYLILVRRLIYYHITTLTTMIVRKYHRKHFERRCLQPVSISITGVSWCVLSASSPDRYNRQ